MTNDEILETAAKNAAYIVKLELEIDELRHQLNVLKLTPEECLSGGFVRGLTLRNDLELSEFDRRMLQIAGECIARIINHQEAKP